MWSLVGPVPTLGVCPFFRLQLKLSVPVDCLQPLQQSSSNVQSEPQGISSELSPQSFLKLHIWALSTHLRFLQTYCWAPQEVPVGREWKPNGVGVGWPEEKKKRKWLMKTIWKALDHSNIRWNNHVSWEPITTSENLVGQHAVLGKET